MDAEAASLRSRLLLGSKSAQKSCGPCRARKVKCNRAAPCVRCMKSGYPELCLYAERARPSVSSIPNPSTWQPNPSSANAQASSSNGIPQVAETSSPRISTTEDLGRQAAGLVNKHLYLGANSLPQFLDDDGTVVASSEDATREGARDAMMPMLGMSPPVPWYPFYVPSENLEEQAIARLCRSLPPSKDMIR